MNQYRLMARFNAWANERLFATVAGLGEAAYRADSGLFFGSIHATLNHLLVVDRMWMGRIEAVDHGVTSLDQVAFEDLEALSAARVVEDARLIGLVDGLDETALLAPVRYSRIIGEGEQVTRSDHILLTLFNHQTHHRGQVTAALTQAGIEPPPLDVIFYLEEVGLS